jgi:hypothetical protein
MFLHKGTRRKRFRGHNHGVNRAQRRAKDPVIQERRIDFENEQKEVAEIESEFFEKAGQHSLGFNFISYPHHFLVQFKTTKAQGGSVSWDTTTA